MNLISNAEVGRFSLLETLSSTGLATVFRGSDPSTGEVVAIKILHNYASENPEILDYFFHEMTQLQTLGDPKVLAPIDLGKDEKASAWLAFPWVSWQSLRRILAEGPISPDKSLSILRQVGEVLDNAHAHGICHRNLKPANIFVSPNGEILVGDFAMATLAYGTHPLIRSTLHSPEAAYTAPDQTAGSERNFSSDVYSLGVIAYELLAGNVPFPLLDTASVRVKQLTESPRVPSSLNPTLPNACDAVMLKALANHPLERYEKCQEFLDALDATLSTAKTTVATPIPSSFSAGSQTIKGSPTQGGAHPDQSDNSYMEGLLCPGCGHGNAQDRIYCEVCWTRLKDRPPDRPLATQQQVTQMRRRIIRELRVRRGVSLSIAGALVLVLAYNVFNAVYSPPVPLGTTTLTSRSQPGDTAMYGINPARTGSVTEGPAIQGNLKWTFVTDKPLLSSPAVVKDVVYQTTGDRRVVALNANDGSLIWEYPTSGPIDSSPAVTGGMVYFGQRDGEFTALDSDTGTVLWGFSAGNPIIGSPVVDLGVVYIGSGDGTMYALDAQTGEKLWSFDAHQWIISSVALHQDVVLVTNSSGRMFALDRRTGERRMRFAADQALVSTAALADGRLYLASALGRLVSIDPLQKEYPLELKVKYWQAQAWAWGLRDSPPTPRGLIWARAFGRRAAIGAPAVVGDTVYITLSVGPKGDHGELRALDTATGGKERTWTYHADAMVHSSPTIVGRWIYFGSKDGKIHAVDRETGEARWVLQAAKGDISTRPVVGSDTLFVASRDGTLYAIR